MKIDQGKWTTQNGWVQPLKGTASENSQLVIVFGSNETLKNRNLLKEIKKICPKATVCGCSTAGEICGTSVNDDSLVATAVNFEKSTIKNYSAEIKNPANSRAVGEQLGDAIEKKGLKHVMVFAEGLHINGSDLVRGMMKKLPENVKITGGLAGDGTRFKETLVVADGIATKNNVAAIAFYGDHLKIGYGSVGGWDPFGPERIITRSKGNVLYEMDGKSALALYKDYLGEHAKGLPATGLLFPLSIRDESGQINLVRTILSVNEEEQSLTFAGDVPEGSFARLMKANFDRLIDGAANAAKNTQNSIHGIEAEFAILISCVGRKLILKQRVEEEVESVHEILGDNASLTGFYSYGEISPTGVNLTCALHNQTMTITAFSEK